MKPFSMRASLWALGLVVSSAGPLPAAWNNVFQVTCHRRDCRSSAAYVQAPVVTSASPAACCNPCPQPVCCTTRYVQRCYYQPVTTYQTKTYYQAVTTYQTKYYYAPVTSVRYSCYVDPCTGCTQQVACPTTSYQLRAQSCPVQSWVQRCCSVPVTTYQRQCCWEPQTCCSTPAPCASCSTGVAQVPVGVAPNPPTVQEQQQYQQPQQQYQQPQQQYQQPQQTPPPPTVDEKKSGGAQYYQSPNAPGASFRPQTPGAVPVRPVGPAPASGVRPDRIVSAPAARVEGQVMKRDRTPRGGTQVMFVSAQRHAKAQFARANAAGQFQVSLASGGWLVYVTDAAGRQTFHSRIEINGAQPAPLTVLTR